MLVFGHQEKIKVTVTLTDAINDEVIWASEFIETYLFRDEEGDYVFNGAPCPFLGEDNGCLVYENRPKACREYPHTDRKNMFQILELTATNTTVCPAVARIVEKITNP